MTWQTYKPLTIMFLLATASSANQGVSAVQRFQTLQESVKKSHDAKEWRTNVASARELKEFMNGAPDSLLELARAEIHAGELADAVRNVEAFARMGQSTDLFGTSAEFASPKSRGQ
jgi:hypothetical protein